MKKLKVYLDTSIVSFLYADDEPEKKALTVEFFESYLEKYDVAISQVVTLELGKTNDMELREQLLGAVKKYSLPMIVLAASEDDEVSVLADEYLRAGVIPASKPEDALHLAIASVLEYDVLLSWNFRHLANIRKQVQVNAVNTGAGYLHPLSLLSPMEVMYAE